MRSIYSPYRSPRSSSKTCNSNNNSFHNNSSSLDMSPLYPDPVKENTSGTMTSARIRRGLLMTVPTFLGLSLLVLVVVSTSPDGSEPSALSSSSSASSSQHRHPFIRPNRRRSLFSTYVSSNPADSEPQFLVFGTSSTFGVGLEHPLTEAYAYQLSRTAHNAATQNGGYTLAAACTQSIVRDNVYDVIVLEFKEWEPAMSVLAQRLRLRFPNAFLVFLRLWHPSQLHYRHENGTVVDFHEFRKIKGNRAIDDPELYLEVLASKDQWYFDKPNDESLVLDEAAKTSASYFAMNIPDSDLFEYPKTMMDQLSIFQEDSDNLNAQGHSVVAASLRSVMKGHALQHERNKVGSWGAGDECRLWYENGLYHAEKDTKRLRRVEFDTSNGANGGDWFVGPNHKHALEVSPRGSTLHIDNPFAGSRLLYLTYLTAPASAADGGTFDDVVVDGDRSSNHENNNNNNKKTRYGSDNTATIVVREYPQLRIRINDRPAIQIEALHDHGSDTEELARTSAVGMVPPGRSTVHLDPLILPSSSPRAFRLLGWSLLPEQYVQGLELEYSLEQTRVRARDYWNWFSSSSRV